MKNIYKFRRNSHEKYFTTKPMTEKEFQKFLFKMIKKTDCVEFFVERQKGAENET